MRSLWKSHQTESNLYLRCRCRLLLPYIHFIILHVFLSDESAAASASNRGGPTEVFFFPDEGTVRFHPSSSPHVDHDVEIIGRSGPAVRSPASYSPASSSSASHSPMGARKLPSQMPSHLDYNSDETDEDELPPPIREDGESEDEADGEDVGLQHQQHAFNISEEIDRAVMNTSLEEEEEAEHYSADEEFCIIDDPGLGIAVSYRML